VTLTLTLDRVILQTVVYHSSTSIYLSNFVQIGKNFLWLDGHTDIETGFSRLLRVDFKTYCLYVPLTDHHEGTDTVPARDADDVIKLLLLRLHQRLSLGDSRQNVGHASTQLIHAATNLKHWVGRASCTAKQRWHDELLLRHTPDRQTDRHMQQSRLLPLLTTSLICCRLYVIHINHGQQYSTYSKFL